MFSEERPKQVRYEDNVSIIIVNCVAGLVETVKTTKTATCAAGTNSSSISESSHGPSTGSSSHPGIRRSSARAAVGSLDVTTVTGRGSARLWRARRYL